MWPGNLAAFVWQVPVPCSVSSCCTDPLCHHTSRAQSSELCTQPGQTSHSLEGQTSQITQEIYKWIKMRVNLSQVRHIQPGLQRLDRILSCSYCLLLSGHSITSFQLCNYTMNTQHLVSVWSTPHQSLNGRMCWLNSSGRLKQQQQTLIALAFSHSQCGHSGMRMAFADGNLLIQLITEEPIWECPLLALECFTSRKYHILSQPGSHHCRRTGDGAAGRAALCKIAEGRW